MQLVGEGVQNLSLCLNLHPNPPPTLIYEATLYYPGSVLYTLSGSRSPGLEQRLPLNGNVQIATLQLCG